MRAAEESIAYQSADLIAAMERDVGQPIRSLRVDGGATRDSFLMQFQADVIGKPVLRPVIRETTALGAAYLAGLAVGYWKSLDDIRSNWAIDRVFNPGMDEEKRCALLKGWNKAVKCALRWGED